MSEQLITKYRPTTWKTVIGHAEIMAALESSLSNESHPHCFLMTGNGGIGKTTIARIIAGAVGAEVVEIIASVNSGVDDMREIVELGAHVPLSGSGTRMIIIDECFAPETRVNTPDGYRRIDEINAGDFVIGVQGPQRVKRTMKNKLDLTRIVQLRLSDGRSIMCSEDHAFLSDSGWIAAKDTIHAKSITTVNENIPHTMQKMWDRDYEQRRGYSILRKLLGAGMPRMWKEILEQRKDVFTSLRKSSRGAETMRTTFTGTYRGCKTRAFETCQNRSGVAFSKKIIRSNEVQKPYGKSNYYQKNGRNEKSKWHSGPVKALALWEWPWSFQTTGNVTWYDRWCNGIRSLHQYLSEITELSTSLQNRYRDAISKASCGSGWEHTSNGFAEKTGCEKRQVPVGLRVESVTRLQQRDIEQLRSRGGTYFENGVEYVDFYDLEVSNHPSYSVEDAIVHNCHRLSKNGWDALLRITEEPPPFLYFAFCTTEPHKVPATMKQRCYPVPLSAVKVKEIADLIEYIALEEGWTIADDVFSLILQECEGSPRKAIGLLQSLHSVKTAAEAARVVTLESGEDEPSKVMARLLLMGSKDWDRVQRLLLQLDELATDWEQVYIGVCRYMIKVMTSTKKPDDAARAFQVLNLFTIPTNSFDPKAVFFAAVGRVFWS